MYVCLFVTHSRERCIYITYDDDSFDHDEDEYDNHHDDDPGELWDFGT